MRVDTLYFVPDLEEMLSTFHIEYDVSLGLSYMRFIILKQVTTMLTLWRVIINGC